MNLIPDKISGNNHPWTKNRYGAQVFRDPNDFTTAVPEYFDHAEWFVQEAGKREIAGPAVSLLSRRGNHMD